MSGVIKNNILQILNPVSGDIVDSINLVNENDIENIFNTSSSYNNWSKLNLNERCNIINKFRKVILSHRENIENIIKSETEKSDNDIFIEFLTTLEHFKEIVKIARFGLKKERRNAGIMKLKKAFVEYEPVGTIGIISPWNYPLATPIGVCIEALLAGNNVILKPSEHTPLTMIYIKNLWDEHIDYQNAFQVIIGDGLIGNLLVESNKIDMICFTGSTTVGKIIAEKCGKLLKPVILELGGKDPMIILKDANMNRAVNAALFGGLTNAGQTCISTEDIYIEEDIFDIFVEKIKVKIENLHAGNSENNQIGAMIMPGNTEKVMEHINELKDSCQIISGKSEQKEMFIAPTIIINPPENSRISKEESFGPVISIISFSKDSSLIEKINNKGYGLSASIFGRNKKRIKSIASNIKTGNISINDVITHYGIASLPFGGVGLSGIGKIHGIEGLKSFCITKSYTINRFNNFSDPWWYNSKKYIHKIIKKTLFIYK